MPSNTFLCWLSLHSLGNHAFYLPGVPPHEYAKGDPITVTANALTSVDTMLSFDYYALPFCTPDDGIHRKNENLGERLAGDTMDNTPFDIRMLEDKQCALLCQQTYSRQQLDEFSAKISDNYYVNLALDNLPAAKKFIVFDSAKDAQHAQHELEADNVGEAERDKIVAEHEYVMERGFGVGSIEADTGNAALSNHWNFIIRYNDLRRIVQFELEEESINHYIDGAGRVECRGSDGGAAGAMIIDGPSGFDKVNSMDVAWTYSVSFERSDVAWAQRWDHYLKITNVRVHWMGIANSLMLVILLSGAVGVVLTRILRKDILRINARFNKTTKDIERQRLIDAEDLDDFGAEVGWKNVFGDVFRAPQRPFLFCVLVSSGLQTFLVMLATIVFSAAGFASPAIHGSFANAVIFFFAVFGAANGFCSARLYKLFDGDAAGLRAHLLRTALSYPAFIFAVFMTMDVVVWSGSRSSTAVPFGTLVSLLAIFVAISLPMVLAGGHLGFYKVARLQVPCPANRLPRAVPAKPWFYKKNAVCLAAGVVVFASVFLEMSYIFASLWGHHIYFVFGFLLLIFGVVAVVSAQMSILLVYVRLVHEDYNWWYCSFLAPASSGLVLLAYAVHFFHGLHVAKLWSSYALYFGYVTLMATALALVTGFAGFFGTFWFVRTIYAAIKSD